MNELTYCTILNTNINVTNMAESVKYIIGHMDELRGKYICVSNVHTTVMSYKNENYRRIQNGAALALPDGKPLSMVSRKRGFKQARRVSGPDLMPEIFKVSEEKGYRQYFYGTSAETLENLKKMLQGKYPSLQIAGMYSPPFRPLTEQENEDVIRRINESKPDIIWVGLGAPKQEIWMSEHQGKVNAVMIGVGAGFDFHAGTVKRAPVWMQRLCLEWLYRLLQNPRRLYKRYLSTNLQFIWLLLRGR